MAETETKPEAAPVFGTEESTGEDFKPLYTAPEVEVKTLEEEEIVCFRMRAKLFVFVKEDVYGGEVRKNFWKERGTGDVKLLRHKELGMVRLLMRQEKTLKICANHLVSPHVELSPNVGSDRSWVFTASDFAEEELKTETFAIKFGSAEKANKFKELVELAKKVNSKEIEPEELEEYKDEEEEKPARKKSTEGDDNEEDDAEKLAEGLAKVEVKEKEGEKKK